MHTRRAAYQCVPHISYIIYIYIQYIYIYMFSAVFCYLEINMINIKCAQILYFILHFCVRKIYIYIVYFRYCFFTQFHSVDANKFNLS